MVVSITCTENLKNHVCHNPFLKQLSQQKELQKCGICAYYKGPKKGQITNVGCLDDDFCSAGC